MTPLELRNKKGLSQSEIAAKLGLSQSQVSRLEKGESAPSAKAATAYDTFSSGQVKLRDFPALQPTAV